MNFFASLFCACLVILLGASSASGQSIFKARLVFPAANLPPSVPANGFPGEPTDFLLPRAVASAYVARVVGLVYFDFNTTHGTICTGTAITSEWVLTSAHCALQVRMRGLDMARVFLYSEASGVYETFGMSAVFSHVSYMDSSSSSDIGLIRLSTVNLNFPSDAPTFKSTMDNANKRGSTRAHVRWATPMGVPPLLGQSQQMQNGPLCLPEGVRGGRFLCMNPLVGAVYSGAGLSDAGAPLFGTFRSGSDRIAIIGLYAGSNNGNVIDTSRTNYYTVVPRFDNDIQNAINGVFTRWTRIR